MRPRYYIVSARSPRLPRGISCNLPPKKQVIFPGAPGGGKGEDDAPPSEETVNEPYPSDSYDNTSKRRPSATLGFLLLKQLQFLAMLSLVEYIVGRDSWFGNFVVGLR